jgi:hypothetical protein
MSLNANLSTSMPMVSPMTIHAYVRIIDFLAGGFERVDRRARQGAPVIIIPETLPHIQTEIVSLAHPANELRGGTAAASVARIERSEIPDSKCKRLRCPRVSLALHPGYDTASESYRPNPVSIFSSTGSMVPARLARMTTSHIGSNFFQPPA